MRILFAGTPVFAATALQALLEAGHDVVLVLTQPDRPAGRGLQPTASAVRRAAEARLIAVQQPVSLRDSRVVDALAALHPDVMVVAAYGLILPGAVLRIPARGCLNIHASLLPRWRGAAPIQRAILAGDAQTGITIMQMDEGLDTGDILLQQPVPITPDDTAGSLHDKLARVGAELIVTALATNPAPRPQDPGGATYASKIQKSDARIDWGRDAVTIERQVRALNPSPGAVTHWDGMPLKIWSSHMVSAPPGRPGEVCEADSRGIVVACGQGALCVTELQRAGGKRLTAAAFVAGRSLRGARMGD